MKGIEDTVKMLQKNPRRAGGPLDPATGLTRTAARQVLQKLAREGKINKCECPHCRVAYL